MPFDSKDAEARDNIVRIIAAVVLMAILVAAAANGCIS